MDKRIQVYCGSCEGVKHHKKLFVKHSIDSVTKAQEDYTVVQCLGCGTPAFLLIVKYKGKNKPVHFVYPYDAEEEDFYFLDYDYKAKLPSQIRQLYDEIEHLFDSDSVILAGVGLRTLVEALCIDRKIPGHNLHLKIRGLYDNGFISMSELPILDKLRLIGNSSAHEIKSLPMDKLELALSIVNHVLISVYILPEINRQLKVSKRSKLKSKTSSAPTPILSSLSTSKI